MTYYESAQDQTITHDRALQELTSHGVTFVDGFYQECGKKENYLATNVLDFLGY